MQQWLQSGFFEVFLFAGLFYLIIALLLTALSSEANPLVYEEAPRHALAASLAIYTLLMAAVYQSARLGAAWTRKHKSLSFAIANSAILAFLLLYHFAFAADRAIPSTFLNALLSMLLYFGALGVYHIGSYNGKSSQVASDKNYRFSYAADQLRVWIPFALPFLLFSFIYDLLDQLPENRWTAPLIHPEHSPFNLAIFLVFVGAIFLSIMVLLPGLIQKLWRCEEISDPILRSRLISVCRQAHFRYRGLRTWTVMNDFYTAAIIGIIPRFRYVMFSKKLLCEVPASSIEAILIHEIGHSYRKHLLYLPLIFFGMFAFASLFSSLFFDGVIELLSQLNPPELSNLWGFLLPLVVLIPYIAALALYFRIVFGFFSRLFERQADLHCYVVGTSPQDMINALDQIGIATGYTHNIPNWHHYSIRQRIDFLQHTINHPESIEKHHRRVKRWIALYLIVFCTISSLLFYLSFADFSQSNTHQSALSTFSDQRGEHSQSIPKGNAP